jgi:transposase-like protein
MVEADESYVGGHHPGRDGRGQPLKGIVVVAVENRGKTAGSARLAVIPNVTKKTLGAFLEDSVDLAQAVVHTDGYPSYKHLSLGGIQHEVHIDEKRAERVHTLPWAHTIFSNLKGWIQGTFHGVSVKHLPKYLDEFAYRFNRRWRDGELFYFVAQRLITTRPVTYAQIVAAEQTG